MLQSQLFTKTEKNAPKDEVTANARLLTRGGFVRKLSAGVYGFLPLGLRVLRNISQIIREEMDAVDGQEVLLSALVERSYMEATNRWDIDIAYDVVSKGEDEARFTLGWSHEEPLTAIVKHFVHSYRDLPFAAYQMQTKFRDEPRAQAGLLRGREFLMKDMYSFHTSEQDMFSYYDRVREAYMKVFSRCGLDAIYTKAPGGDFTTSHTHEFQVLSETGEDTIVLCESCGYAENKEISSLVTGEACPGCDNKVEEKTSIEAGNIFPLGTKYSDSLGLVYDDAEGNSKSVVMGCYGIGVSRLMGAIVEIYHDDNGIVWPREVAPFDVHLLALPGGNAQDIYTQLEQAGVSVLYDERDTSPGEKLRDADLIGIPYRVVVSKKTEGKVEIKKRGDSNDEAKLVSVSELLSLFAE